MVGRKGALVVVVVVVVVGAAAERIQVERATCWSWPVGLSLLPSPEPPR